MTLLPLLLPGTHVPLQAQTQQQLLLLLGLQKRLTTALITSQAKKAAWLFIFQQLICYAWLKQNRGASLLEEAQGGWQMLRGCCVAAARGDGSGPGTSWRWLPLSHKGCTALVEGKTWGKAMLTWTLLGKVRQEGEHSLSMSPRLGLLLPGDTSHPSALPTPGCLTGLGVTFPRCQQPGMALPPARQQQRQ